MHKKVIFKVLLIMVIILSYLYIPSFHPLVFATGEELETQVIEEIPTLVDAKEEQLLADNDIKDNVETMPRIDYSKEIEFEEQETSVMKESPQAVDDNEMTNENENDLSGQGKVAEESWFVFDEATNTITGYSTNPNAPKSIIIPEQINGVDVYYIQDEAFSGQQLTYISFNTTKLKGIGKRAFQNNPSMMGDIVLPDSVTELGDSAFYKCSSLNSVTLGNGITSINYSTFSDCSRLISIIIGNNVTTINASAFYNCSRLDSIVIPDNVLDIKENVFYGCVNLTSIILGNGVTSIGNSAFGYCTSLTSIVIPDNVISIGEMFFRNCTALSIVTFGNGITTIENGAFYDCKNITQVTIGSSITSIGNLVFSGLKDLLIIDIPGKENGSIPGEPWSAPNTTFVKWKGFETVGDFIFDTVTKSVAKYIGADGVVTIPDSFIIDGVSYPTTNISKRAFQNNTTLTSAIIPDSVINISDYVFENCSNLTTITIGSGVTDIAHSVFTNCNNLVLIDIPGKEKGSISGEPWSAPATTFVKWSGFETIGDFIFDTVTKSIAKYVGAGGEVTIPESFVIEGISYSVKGIETGAFQNVVNLTSVVIPDSVLTIGTYAFASCDRMTSVTIGNSVTSIGNYAFYRCQYLTSITIPDSVISIGDSAFSVCTTMTSATIGNSVTSIGKYAFTMCYQLQTITMGNSVANIGDSAFSECSKLGSIVIPDDVTTIKASTFDKCRNLTSITIGSGVTSIADSAFASCGFTSFIIPDSVTSLGRSAFSNCTSLVSIVIPNNITSIGRYLFSYCSALTSVVISNSVTKIEGYSFLNCVSLTTIVMPNSITSIGDYAFSGCSILSSVTIPDTVTTIGSYAFLNCETLATIAIPNSVTSIGSMAFSNCVGLLLIDISGKEKGSISGNPWGAPSSTVIKWKNFEIIGDFIIDTQSLSVVKYLGVNSDIAIPDNFIVNGVSLPVLEIGDNAFQTNINVTSIVIPDSVTKIGNSVFADCDNLTLVILPENMESIGEYAFSNCISLVSVVIPDSVQTIGGYAFYNCNNLTSAVIGSGITVLSNSIFSGCQNLLSVVIPGNVTSIGRSAFSRCDNLENVTIGTGVTDIGEYAFSSNYSLTSIVIPDNVQRIGNYAFNSCNHLTTIKIGNGVTSLGSNAFSDTNALESILVGFERYERPLISNYQPWGASNTVKVYYKGEFVKFEHSVVNNPNAYRRDIRIKANAPVSSLIWWVSLPDGTKLNDLDSTLWPESGYYTYNITSNGTYVFKAEDRISGYVLEYPVDINDIGIITLEAFGGTIKSAETASATEASLLALVGAHAFDEAGDLPLSELSISITDIAKVNAMAENETVTIRVNANSMRSGSLMSAYKDVTLRSTNCTIEADNVKLYPVQSADITMMNLIHKMNAIVTISDGSEPDLTKLMISDADMARIHNGEREKTYTVTLIYDGGLGKKQVQIEILNDSPMALVEIPMSIELKRTEDFSEQAAATNETIKIKPTTDTSLFSGYFHIQAETSFKIESQDSEDFYTVYVFDQDGNRYENSLNDLVTLGEDVTSSVFQLKAFGESTNGPGLYRGTMDFYIRYEEGGDS